MGWNEAGGGGCRTFSAHSVSTVIQGLCARFAPTRPWLPAAAPLALRLLCAETAQVNENQDSASYENKTVLVMRTKTVLVMRTETVPVNEDRDSQLTRSQR